MALNYLAKSFFADGVVHTQKLCDRQIFYSRGPGNKHPKWFHGIWKKLLQLKKMRGDTYFLSH